MILNSVSVYFHFLDIFSINIIIVFVVTKCTSILFINGIIEFVLTKWIFICFIIPHLPGEGC